MHSYSGIIEKSLRIKLMKELIKIGDAAVSEKKVVETTAIASPEKEEKSENEKKSTSTKKAKSRKQSRGTGRVKIQNNQEEKELNAFK